MIQWFAFASAKGGVGKSTLAVTCASLWAEAGARVVILDLDLSGTSLADGLSLVAPDLADESGALDLTRSGASLLSLPETRRRREDRRLRGIARLDADEEFVGGAIGVPFLNDAFHFRPPPESQLDCRLDSMFWRREVDDGVAYFPSSPLEGDVVEAVAQLYVPDPEGWMRRLAWILHALLEQMRPVDVVVLDLPPGLVGFADRVLALGGSLGRGDPPGPGFPPLGSLQWKVRSFLVTTEDRNDWQAALEYRYLYRPDLLPALTPVVNRAVMGREDFRAQVRESLPHFDVARRLAFVDADPLHLGRVFRGRSQATRPGGDQLRRLFGIEKT